MEEEQEQDEKKEEEKEDVFLYASDHGPCMMHQAPIRHSFPIPNSMLPLPCLPLSEADARMHTTSLRMSAERSVNVKGMPHPTRIGWERDKQMDRHVDGCMGKDGRIDCARWAREGRVGGW